jgi:hypothetical protein
VVGMTLNAVDGLPLGGVNVRIGSATAVSAADGSFQMEQVGSGPQAAVLSSASIVERHTTVTALPAATVRESLIPSTFDLTAFNQMFRGPSDRLQRWTTAPSLVVLTSVMNFTAGFGDQENFFATSKQLTDAETTQLVEHLTEALALLTGNTFTSFASVELESHSSGDKVNSLRPGKIVIGRYNGIQGLLNTVGFGRWALGANGEVVGGSIFLDTDYDESHESRRLLRTHELGHALGYNHVTSRVSIMNPAIGPDPTVFDRQGAIIAFQRPPGNRSPDSDPVETKSTGLGASVPSTAEWSPPIF